MAAERRTGARLIREAGNPSGGSPTFPTVLEIGAIADGEYLMRDGTTIVGAPAALTGSSGVAPATTFSPTFSDQLIDWMCPLATGGGTQAQVAGRLRYHPHVEEQTSRTYDALMFATGTSPGAGALAKVAIYSSNSSGKPASLLWYGGDVDISSSGSFYTTFAGGTWTAAGASYRDGSDRLTLTQGQAIYRAWIRNTVGSPTSRRITDPRSLGVADTGTFLGFVGFEETVIYASAFPSTATPGTGFTGTVIYLPLRWV